MRTEAREIMQAFAVRTGLGRSDRPPTRYLWTDAYAVCNWLGFFVEAGDEEAKKLAIELVDETHHVLGRHRPDDVRSGWISGLDEERGARHPTVGGLRIGKPLPERAPGERFDSRLEWERDGQYFHYLTRWLVALDSVAHVTEDSRYRQWALELAHSAFARFSVRDENGSLVGLRWKMNIDLSRPLIPSMAPHDALDGYLVYERLQSRPAQGDADALSEEIQSLSQLCVGRDWSTDDPLGIGGLLSDAHALAKTMAADRLKEPILLAGLLRSALTGLRSIAWRGALEAPAEQRLPFRELGLAIGLHAVPRIEVLIEHAPEAFANRRELRSTLEAIDAHFDWSAKIVQFWREPANRRSPSWVDHLDINEVMLATTLAPYGVLEI
jgi:hypothetical protein